MRTPAVWAARVLIVVLALGLLSGCTSHSFGKGVQAAEAQKLAVEQAADEVVRLHERRQIPDTAFAQARDAYNDWATVENAYAEALILWRRSKTAENDHRVQVAIVALAPKLKAVTKELCAFRALSVNLDGLCTKMDK